MKNLWMVLGLAAAVSLASCAGCNPVSAQEYVSWGDVKVQLEEEPAGKLVVGGPAAGTAERGKPKIKITNVSPMGALLSAGNGVQVDYYEIQADRWGLWIFSLPVFVSPGLENVRVYLTSSVFAEEVQIGPTLGGSGVQQLNFGTSLGIVPGQKVGIEFRATISNYPVGTPLRVDLLAGFNNVGLRRSGDLISSPAVRGVGGTVSYPWGCVDDTGFSAFTGEPCSNFIGK